MQGGAGQLAKQMKVFVYLAAFAGERPEVEAGGGLVANLAQLIHLKQEATIRIIKKSC